MTREGIEALQAKRKELSTQLNSAQGRRNDVAREIGRTTGPALPGLEQRLAILDSRIMQIETDIAANGQQLAAAPLNLVSSQSESPRYGPFSSGQLTAISIVSIVLVWAPLAFAAARMMLRRSPAQKPTPQLLEGVARLERMEQAVDSIAIEVERISEGQRFVTQLMSKKPDMVALAEGSAPAQPIAVAQPEQVHFEKRSRE